MARFPGHVVPRMEINVGTGQGAPTPAPTSTPMGGRPQPLPSGQDPGEQQAPTITPQNQVLTQ
jgi:hypothetical protein